MGTLAVGDMAPDFSSVDSDGRPISLSQFAGKTVVLYFYPKASTPGCTREGIRFNERLDWFRQHDVVVLGVSTDSPQAQAKFRQRYSLAFTMVSDRDRKISSSYGILRETGTAARTTFLIGRDGTIAAVIQGVKPEEHAEKVIREIEELGMA
ncbi:MAG: peroxiredoxin [Thermoprotei archaeon]